MSDPCSAVQLCLCVGQAHCGLDVIMSFQANQGRAKMPTGPRYCLMTDRPYQKKTPKKTNKKNFMKATSCGGELSPCLETVQNFSLGKLQAAALVYKICLLEGRRRRKKRLLLFQQQRFSQTICKNKSSETRRPGCIRGTWQLGWSL